MLLEDQELLHFIGTQVMMTPLTPRLGGQPDCSKELLVNIHQTRKVRLKPLSDCVRAPNIWLFSVCRAVKEELISRRSLTCC